MTYLSEITSKFDIINANVLLLLTHFAYKTLVDLIIIKKI